MPADFRALEARRPKRFINGIASFMGAANWSGDTAHWNTPTGPLRAEWSKLDAIAIGGRRVRGVIDVAQQVLVRSPEEAKAMVERHNRQPSLGLASVLPGPPAVVEMTSRACLYDNDQTVKESLDMILLTAAMCHVAISREYAGMQPANRLPTHDEPCRWRPAELIELKSAMEEMGDVVSLSDHTLVAKFSSMGDRLPGGADSTGAQLALSGSHRHSVMGAGLAVELCVSISPGREAANALVSHLNQLEMNRWIGPPLFGAWCTDPKGRHLVFGSFFPNLAWSPDFLPRIASWSEERLALVKNELEQVKSLSKSCS